MASLRKALKDALPNKRITVMDGKENRAYVETPQSKRTHWANTRTALSEKPPRRQSDESAQFKRNNKLTLSVRDVVGSVRQKLKKSTRQRKRLQDAQSPLTSASRFKKNDKGKKTPTRKGGYREVKMYSPFGIDTPPRKRTPVGIRTRPMWHDVETPTRLRKEVEDLTANMQALINLTPQTLKSRSVSRRDHLGKFTYLPLVLKEVLRYYSPVPIIGRRHDKPIEIDGIEIPVGVTVWIQVYAIHHNEEIWPNNWEFDPERFCVDRRDESDVFKFIPFSAGSSFMISLDDAHEPVLFPDLIMRSEN